tara:strand:- start:87 stop:593 length:507 start_codon:yes stop_codon:yes gene_type:complete
MSHTVSGLIRKAPHIQAGQNNNGNYTMFCFELAEFNKGTQGKEDSYTNYSVALFAKSQGAIDFHGKAIAEGSFVVVNCDKLMVEKQVSKQDGREFIKLKMMNASLGDFNNPNQQQAAPQQQAPQQGGFANQDQTPQQQQAPAQYQPGQGFQPQQPPQHQGGYQNQPGK